MPENTTGEQTAPNGRRGDMQIALLSDIHSNLPALEAVLTHIRAQSWSVDRIYCLGDIVGYGAQPLECVERIRETCHGVVLGNHDLAVADGTGEMYLPRDGQAAAQHNRAVLPTEARTWLRDLPMTVADDVATFVHATPLDPERWLRMESFHLTQAQFRHFDTDLCFTGHTHMPGILSQTLGVFRIRPGHRYLVNVGSVGQPRDGDPRACVAYLDTETLDYRLERVAYNVDAAARAIKEAGLPRALASRLERGT
ncbi:MAG: metallophosphoesterase family protein [Rhodothermales bacterium]